MDIEINDEAKKWIETKGAELTVKILQVDGCCAPNVQEVVAIPGKPKIFDDYHPLKIDNFTIYVQKNLLNKEKLTLKLSGISFLKTISAKVR